MGSTELSKPIIILQVNQLAVFTLYVTNCDMIKSKRMCEMSDKRKQFQSGQIAFIEIEAANRTSRVQKSRVNM